MSSEISNSVENLVNTAKQGDTQAFGELYEIYALDMYRYALWYLGNEAQAQDAVSDAVCSAFASIKDLKKPKAFKGWIFKILVNSCKKYLTEKINDRSTDELESVSEYANADSLEGNTELYCAVEQLKENQRSVLLLSVIGGYKSEEIAAMLHMNASTVRSTLSRTLAVLKNELGENRRENYNG